MGSSFCVGMYYYIRYVFLVHSMCGCTEGVAVNSPLAQLGTTWHNTTIVSLNCTLVFWLYYAMVTTIKLTFNFPQEPQVCQVQGLKT